MKWKGLLRLAPTEPHCACRGLQDGMVACQLAHLVLHNRSDIPAPNLSLDC